MAKIQLAALLLLVLFCLGNADHPAPPGTFAIPPSPQRAGDPTAGYDYLLYGDMVGRGIPLAVYKKVSGGDSPDDLGRTGDSQGISFQFNVVEAPNGVKVVAPTCLNCHAEKLNGALVIGLGNNSTDHTYDHAGNFRAADFAVQLRFGKQSPEWEAYYPLSRGYKAVGPYIQTKVRGPNPADKIFAALAAHRKADDLSWLPEAQFEVPVEVVPTDVPAWWLLKKKHALYYNGLGTGDFARLSSASGMLVMADSAEARRIDERMVDLIAWIRTIEPPAYPFPVDATLAAQGKLLFEKTCKKCHGSYGDDASYPNLVVKLDIVGTDSLLAQAYRQYPEYTEWYNRSWYAQEPYGATLQPTWGYIAPPLDGVWATAPYLHNGSVPTIDDLLNSPQRPVYWKRSFDNSDYNPEKLGWRYSAETGKTDSKTYDTTLPGYGNGGHTFGDKLTTEERKAVLEYLKTL
ncbi:MAG: c-type cytochrome [Lewinellaceae bacterium]|nr:c-type cytochrome [Lewinellaceae bacterium]